MSGQFVRNVVAMRILDIDMYVLYVRKQPSVLATVGEYMKEAKAAKAKAKAKAHGITLAPRRSAVVVAAG